MIGKSMNKVLIIGNVCGGKTTLSRILSKSLHIPLYHMDSFLFLPGWKQRSKEDIKKELNKLVCGDDWIIEGFGNRDIVDSLLKAADTVIFIDYPVLVHFWMAIKRQIMSRRGGRLELPENCPEFTIDYTIRLFKTIWKGHTEFRPWICRTIMMLPVEKYLVHVKSLKSWRKFVQDYCEPARPASDSGKVLQYLNDLY